MGVAVVGRDSLTERAAMMRESLQKSQTITDNVVTILGSFDHRLSVLETAMRPTQVFISIQFILIQLFSHIHLLLIYLQIRTHSIRKAHENIDRTLKSAEVILAKFDLSRQVRFSDSLCFTMLAVCFIFHLLNIIFFFFNFIWTVLSTH